MTRGNVARTGDGLARLLRCAGVLLLCLAATGCTGLGAWRDAINGDPVDKVSLPDSTTVRELRGQPVHQAPLLPQPGDIWAGVQPTPNETAAAAPDQAPVRPQPGNIWADVLPNPPANAAPPAAAHADKPAPQLAPSAAAPSAAAPHAAQATPQPASTAARHPPPGGATGHLLVQLAATSSRNTAERAWRDVEARNRALLRGHRPLFERAEVNGRTVWRLRADGFSGFAEANKFCSRLVAPRLDCWVVSGSPRS